MNIHWKITIYRLRSRIIRNILALLSLSAMLSACGNTKHSDKAINQDSLKQIEEEKRQDSIAKADSITQAKEDSIALQNAEDSANQTVNPVPPVIYIPEDPKPEYGVEPVYEEPNDPITKYGVPTSF